MSTNGIFGFRIDGQDRLAYNHHDSYPSGLGEQVVEWVRLNIDGAELQQAALRACRDLRVVSEEIPPTKGEIAKLLGHADTSVSTMEVSEWYVLLRRTQGHLDRVLDCGYILDSADFMGESLFCEWAYIVNFDEGVFEVYEGFQKSPHNEGRYSTMTDRTTVGDSSYYPVALLVTFPLQMIPENWVQFVESLEQAE